jgi:hypothetical protein
MSQPALAKIVTLIVMVVATISDCVCAVLAGSRSQGADRPRERG